MEPIPQEHGINSANLLVIVENGKASQRYVIKSTARGKADSLGRSMAIQHFCHERNAPVPATIPGHNGELVSLDGDKAYVLQEYCGGQPMRGTRSEIEDVARALARVNLVLSQYTGGISDPSPYADLTTDELEAVVTRDSPDTPTEFTSKAMGIVGDLSGAYREYDSIAASGDLPVHPTHLDCHPMNTVFSADHRVVVLDFGHVQRVPRMLSAAFACHRFTGFDAGWVGAFINAYHSIDSLSPMEVERYPLFVAREAIRRVNYILRSHFFGGDTSWDFDFGKQIGIWRDAVSHMGKYKYVLA